MPVSSCQVPGLQGDLQPSHLFRQLLLCHVHPAEDQPAQKAFPEQSFSPVALLFDLLNVVHQPLFPGDLPAEPDQRLRQLIRVDGLEQVVKRLVGDCLLGVLKVPVSGEENDVGLVVSLPHLLRQLQSV